MYSNPLNPFLNSFLVISVKPLPFFIPFMSLCNDLITGDGSYDKMELRKGRPQEWNGKGKTEQNQKTLYYHKSIKLCKIISGGAFKFCL